MNGVLCQHGFGLCEQIMAVSQSAHSDMCKEFDWKYIPSTAPIKPSHRWGSGMRFQLLRTGLDMVKMGQPVNYFDSDVLQYDRSNPATPRIRHMGMTPITNRQMGIVGGWQAGAIYTVKTPETIKIVDWMIEFYNRLGDRDIEAEKVFVSEEFPYRKYLEKIPEKWNFWEWGMSAHDREADKALNEKPIVVAAHGQLWKSKLNTLQALLKVSRHA